MRSGLSRSSVSSIEAAKDESRSARVTGTTAPKRAERREQGAPDLAGRSGDENAHQTCPYLGRCLISARSGAAASRADNLGLSKPHVNADGRIVPSHDNFVCRAVKFVALVEEIGRFGKHHKAMRKAARYPDLPVIVLASIPPRRDGRTLGCRRARRRRRRADARAAPYTSFPCVLRVLQVQSAQHAVCGSRKIVLNKRSVNTVAA